MSIAKHIITFNIQPLRRGETQPHCSSDLALPHVKYVESAQSAPPMLGQSLGKARYRLGWGKRHFTTPFGFVLFLRATLRCSGPITNAKNPMKALIYRIDNQMARCNHTGPQVDGISHSRYRRVTISISLFAEHDRTKGQNCIIYIQESLVTRSSRAGLPGCQQSHGEA